MSIYFSAVSGAVIGNPGAATGLSSQASQSINVAPAGTTRWSFDSSGNLIQATANLFIELIEGSVPANPAANTARLFCRDNGAGKTQIGAIFPTGVTVDVATEV